MLRNSFISSAILHALVLGLMAMDFSLGRFDRTPPPPALMVVDLTKIKIADKTNLPPKLKPQKTIKKSTPTPQKQEQIKSTKVSAPKAEPPKATPKPQKPVKDAVPVVPKPEPKPQKTSKKTTKPTQQGKSKGVDNQLKNLLASVEKVRTKAKPTTLPEPEEILENEGIEGGLEGSYSQILTISDTDLIRHQLSKCWNLDAGKKDIDSTIIEIRALLARDGSIREVKILNRTSDPVFRSVAESAKRAVYICSQKEDSPFKMLSEKYESHYNDWKSIHLRFNPRTGDIM